MWFQRACQIDPRERKRAVGSDSTHNKILVLYFFISNLQHQTTQANMATETISVELETLDEHQSTRIATSQARSEDQSPPGVAPKYLPNNVAIAVITQLAGINLLTSFAGGLITVGLPTIAADLQLPQNLLVWPVSVFYLTSCSTLLLAGSLADVIGARTCNLIGCFFLAAFVLACGMAETGIQYVKKQANSRERCGDPFTTFLGRTFIPTG